MLYENRDVVVPLFACFWIVATDLAGLVALDLAVVLAALSSLRSGGSKLMKLFVWFLLNVNNVIVSNVADEVVDVVIDDGDVVGSSSFFLEARTRVAHPRHLLLGFAMCCSEKIWFSAVPIMTCSNAFGRHVALRVVTRGQVSHGFESVRDNKGFGRFCGSFGGGCGESQILVAFRIFLLCAFNIMRLS